jgi:hypothetical protein
MSLDVDIDAALSGLAGGKSYCEEAPAGVVAPYIVWAQVVETPENTLDGPSARNTRLQVDIFAKTRTECDALLVQVIDALTVPPVGALELSRQRFTEDAVGLKRTVVDFSIWH